MLQSGYAGDLHAPVAGARARRRDRAHRLAFNTVGDGLRDALGMGQQKVKGSRPVWASPASTRDRAGAEPAGESERVRAPPSRSTDLTVEFLTDAGPVDGRRRRRVLDRRGRDARPRRRERVGQDGHVAVGHAARAVAARAGSSAGSICFDGSRPARGCRFKEMRELRGTEIAMIFQDPMTSLNPAFTVGNQLVEAPSPPRERSAEARPGHAPWSCSTWSASPTPEARLTAVPAPALGRHAPAGDDRDGARQPTRSCSSPTSRRPRST